jgi:hypothetical protein
MKISMEENQMKKMSVIMLVLALVIVALPIGPAVAQSATNTAWVSSITYYTPSDTGGTLQIAFYAQNSDSSVTVPPILLNPHAAGSLYVGGVSQLGTFMGSAVLSSDVYVIATAVQIAGGSESNNYSRQLYSGFTSSDASPTVYLATYLRQKFGSTSLAAIQNTDNFSVTVNVKIYAAGNTSPAVNKNFDIPAQSMLSLPANNTTTVGVPTNFNGSLVATATKKGDPSTPGHIVAAAQETDDAGRGAYAFEGVSAGSNTVYMASMQCNAFSDQQISYYAIQNTSVISTASVVVSYYDNVGNLLMATPSRNLNPLDKLSVNPCSDGVASGKYGSSVISSTGAPIIAVGKVKANNGLATAFVGAAAGSAKVALPYVRWAATPATDYTTYLAVMNVGGGNATNVQAKYYDGSGTLKATHALATVANPQAPFIKRNTDATTAGALQSNGTFGFPVGAIPTGGSVEITSDQPIVVVVRAQKNVSLGAITRFGEDYSGLPIP